MSSSCTQIPQASTPEAPNHQPGDRQSERGNSTQASAVQVSAPKNSHLNNYNLHLPLTNATSNNLLILTKQLQKLLLNFLLSSAFSRLKLFKGIHPRAIPRKSIVFNLLEPDCVFEFISSCTVLP